MTPIGAGLDADSVALPAGPLAGVAVAAVEAVDPVAVAEALVARPTLDAVSQLSKTQLHPPIHIRNTDRKSVV